MRPGSALVEVFPCRFPADWASHYFWRPALVERRLMPFQIHMQDEARCQPSVLEKNPGGVLPQTYIRLYGRHRLSRLNECSPLWRSEAASCMVAGLL